MAEEEKNKKIKKKRTLLQKIVNAFLYFVIGIFIILVVAFGFSQTSTFRDILKDKVLKAANSSLNGNLYIEKIDGTIFTSLVLHNIVLTQEKDTLLHAESITLRTSPLKLLLKTIYVRELKLKNTDFKLIKDPNGVLNISKLFPASQPTVDTTTSKFPFKIEVADLTLDNINFYLQDYNNLNSNAVYPELNLNDFRVTNLNLNLKAFADINENRYQLLINNLSCNPNLLGFALNNFSGTFLIDKDKMRVQDLLLKTKNTDINIQAAVDKWSPFVDSLNIFDSPISLKLDAPKLYFSDLYPFIPGIDILSGKTALELNASGKLNNIKVDHLETALDSTHLLATATIKNLDDPDDLYITADFNDSYINQNDVNLLLPTLNIPTFKEYGVLKLDTLHYEGNPLNFQTNLFVSTSKGQLKFKGNLNLQGNELIYKANAFTNNFDLSPLVGFNSNINSKIKVEGKGTSPNNLDAVISLTANGSSFYGNNLDTLKLNANAKNKNISYDFRLTSDSTKAKLQGSFDFTDETHPSYEIKGSLNDFNVADVSKDTSVNTHLNLSLDATGQNFDPDNLDLFLSLKMYNSSINNILIDSTRAIVDLHKDDKGQRVVNIISDLADITLTGHYTLDQTIKLINYEDQFIAKAITEKKNQIESIKKPENKIALDSALNRNYSLQALEIDSTLNMNYVVEFKDFSLLSLFLGDNQLELDGYISGKIENDLNSFYLKFNTNLAYVKFWGSSDVFFLSNLSLNLDLDNSFKIDSLLDINAKLLLKTDRVFTGNDFYDLYFKMDYSHDSASVAFSGKLEDYAGIKAVSKLGLNSDRAELVIDSLKLFYNQFDLSNSKSISVLYSKDKTEINNFVLVHKEGEISLNGSLYDNGNQDINFNIRELSGLDLITNFENINPAESPDFNINLSSHLTGDLKNPIFNIDVNTDRIVFKKRKFGKLFGSFDYKNENLNIDLKFQDSLIYSKGPALFINGSLPINLGLVSVKERMPQSKPINIVFKANQFNLASFGNILPMVNKLKGYLVADLEVKGTFNDINPSGYIKLNDADFIGEFNNLEYGAGLKLSVSKEAISIDSLLIKNVGTKNGGEMTGSGKAFLDNLEVTSSQIYLNGTLKVLGDISKSATKSIYGDLVISTNGNLELQIDKEGMLIKAPVDVEYAKLTYLPKQMRLGNSSNFIYKYVHDSTSQSKEMDFESLVNLAKEREARKNVKPAQKSNIKYNIDVHVQNEAQLSVVLSKELNQNLTALLQGNFTYENISGRTNAQGQLNLLDGSTLKFIKTFKADGTIKFEGDVTNPNLDIVATYTDYYTPATDSSNSQEVLVAVKIKLKGPLEDLGKNFQSEENNIAVYYGEKAIQNDTPDPAYSKTDAIMFIVAGTFTEGATQQQRNAAASVATSLAGSLLGSFLNQQFGDYVRSFEVRQVGSQTKFNLSGKIQKFRYTIGGTTEIFQDVSRANVKIEYPITQSFIGRLERKEALSGAGISNEMINEIGLKYRFEF